MNGDSEATSHNISVRRGQPIALRQSNPLVARGLRDIAQLHNRATQNLLEPPENSGGPLGICPNTHKPVFARDGRFWPYIQRGVTGYDEVEYASLLKGMESKDVDLFTALYILDLRGTFHAPEQTDFDKDIADLTEAIRRAPENFRGYYYRGFTYAKKGNDDKETFEKAIADYTEAIRLDPDDAELYYGRGFVYWETGDYDKAIADFTEAIRLNPNDARAYDGRGRAYEAKGDLGKCMADCHEAGRLNPTFAKAYLAHANASACLLAARLYFEDGNYDKAIAICTKAIRLDPKYAKAYWDRGVAYKTIGDSKKANLDFDQAERLGFKRPRSPLATPRPSGSGREHQDT